MDIKRVEKNNRLIAEYTVKLEKLTEDMGGIYILSYYASDGSYIGTEKEFNKLVLEMGICPEGSGGNTSCIGKSYKDGRWYGWSHRAMYGFQIGDIVHEGDCCAESGYTDEYLNRHPEKDRSLPVGFKAKTEEDCKRMAIAFADSVS